MTTTHLESGARRLRRCGSPTRIVIVGGGYVGLHTALHLQRHVRPDEARITVIDPQPVMTYQPFLPEVAAGSIEARHVAIPLRKTLRHCEVLTGSVTDVDHDRRHVVVRPPEGASIEVGYDVLVMAPGSVVRSAPVPGLAEEGIGFKTVGQALYLRNHVLSRLDLAATTQDAELRRRALTFVFVGGGYSGVEAIAEIEDIARYATRYYPTIAPADLRWLLVEVGDRILPEVSVSLSDYTARCLTRRGLQVRLTTQVHCVCDGHVELSDGTSVDSDTIVWSAGVRANPLVRRVGVPVDAMGRLVCTADLRVAGVDNVWSAGDCASVPDLSRTDPAARCAPTAQHAVRQAKRLARNILADLRGARPRAYRHRDAGSVASLGLYKGVAEVYGVRVRGVLAWLMHRGYHLKAVPTINRKVRVLADWLLSFLLRREVAALDAADNARREWLASLTPVDVDSPVPVPLTSDGSGA